MSSYGSTTPDEQQPLIVRINQNRSNLKEWEFPGWGSAKTITATKSELELIQTQLEKHPKKLAEWPATAICGNDILSSCLYVLGLVSSKAGILAPVCLGLVAGVLYLFRFIYGEVVCSIPLNGGSYNVLLNTTSKRVASFAASLAILSYIATGVVSGTSACTYLATQLPGLNVVYATIGLLFFFAVLSFIGIAESSMVALIMFIGHTLTLMGLCLLSLFYVYNNPQTLFDNWNTDFPNVNLAGTEHEGTVFTSLFFGFATAMLGVSGFETSSQFVQEQEDGVFAKTLKNMWWGVVIFNPLLSLLALGVLPLNGESGIIANQNTVLANMGEVVSGPALKTWISMDAFIVLSGAVLTAYVGIIGLVRRLASDRVLPSFLMHRNALRGTNHYIIFGYFVIASSLILILNGDVATLSGVYTYAFLGLMILFASGCMLLKFKRAELPRHVVAPWWTCLLGVAAVLIGFLWNLLGDPTVLTYFSVYFLVVLLVVTIMFERIFLLRIFMYVMKNICPSRASPSLSSTGARGGRTIARTIQDITQSPILFFCKKLDLSTINKAILYVRKNEQTSCLRVVHVYNPEETEMSEDFSSTIAMFDRIYPKLKIEFLAIEGTFGPALIEWTSKTLNVSKNMMFIKQTDSNFAFALAKLGGVRVITG